MNTPNQAASPQLHVFRCEFCEGVQYDAEGGPHDCPQCDLRMQEIPLEEAGTAVIPFTPETPI